jgi:glycine hydroxymethyltransferase
MLRTILHRTNSSITYTNKIFNEKLSTADPQIHNLITQEINRQKTNLNLIASENYASLGIMQCLGTPTQNKYSEGFPGRRVYTGTHVVDKIENLAKKRALELFKLDPEVWEVDVQCLSGSMANLVAYSSVLEVGEKVLGMHLSEGGHISHGLKVGDKALSHSAKLYDWEHYGIDDEGWLDYKQMMQVGNFIIIYFDKKIILRKQEILNRK